MQSISVHKLEEALESGTSILDCRPTSDFASSHVPNSISTSINGFYEYMATCLFDKKKPLIVIAEPSRKSEAILRLDIDGFTNLSFFDFEPYFLSIYQIVRSFFFLKIFIFNFKFLSFF